MTAAIETADIECIFDSSEPNLDLDDCKGKTFLKVLLDLVMHDYQPLVSRALSLLFRHFNQRKETLQHLNQVQLLVSETDIENYKQIKRDLDRLRLFVEKSELWVYKKGKDTDSDDRKHEEFDMKVNPYADRQNRFDSTGCHFAEIGLVNWFQRYGTADGRSGDQR